MNNRELRTFLTLAEQPNYQQAAAKLHFAPSTLSRHIQMLEKECGIKLFFRQGRNVYLTEEGKRFLPHARRILMDIESAMTDINREPKETELHLGGCEITLTRGLMDMLASFVEENPQIHLSMVATPNAKTIPMVTSGAVDVGFYYDEKTPADDDLCVVPLFQEEKYAILVREGHPLIRKKNLNLTDLAGLDFVFPHSSCYSVQALLRRFETRGIPVGTTSHVGMLSVATEQVRQSDAAIIALYTASQKMRDLDHLVRLELDEKPPMYICHLLYRKGMETKDIQKIEEYSRRYCAQMISKNPGHLFPVE